MLFRWDLRSSKFNRNTEEKRHPRLVFVSDLISVFPISSLQISRWHFLHSCSMQYCTPSEILNNSFVNVDLVCEIFQGLSDVILIRSPHLHTHFPDLYSVLMIIFNFKSIPNSKFCIYFASCIAIIWENIFFIKTECICGMLNHTETCVCTCFQCKCFTIAAKI